MSWRLRILSALGIVLLIALGARVAAELLEPLVPVLMTLALLVVIFWIIIGKRR